MCVFSVHKIHLFVIFFFSRSVKGFMQNLVHDADPFQSYCNKVFAGWDFCITDPNAAWLKHRSLHSELQVNNFHFFVIVVSYSLDGQTKRGV